MSSEAETTSATETPTTPTKASSGTGSAAGSPSKETDEARTQLVQGRRHLLVKDYFSAVAALAKGCELLAQRFGDTAPELGDAYLTYGRALLELARSENGVLGVNEDTEGGADDEDDEEGGEDDGEEEGEEEADEDDEDKTPKDEDKNGKDDEKNVKAEDKNGKDEDKNGKDEEMDTEESAPAANGTADTNGSAVNGVKENGKVDSVADQTLKEEGEDGDDEDVNNLQLAWEVLELSRGIFQKQLDTDEDSERQVSLKLAEIHLKLGEVGVESENYSTAVEDMKKCLTMQRKFLDEDDRRIAETLYTMGVAYSLANEFDSAIEQFKSASEQIQKRIANLEKKSAEPAKLDEKKAVADDPFYSVQGEIDELKALLPEIKDKVSDMQDFKEETVRRMMDGLAEVSAKVSSSADGAGPSSASDKPASDKPVSSVAHLVKRKPKEEVPVPQVDKTDEKDKAETIEKSETVVKSESMETSEDKEDQVDKKRKQEEDLLKDDGKKVKVDETVATKPSE